jgi:hypothetical protein
MAQPGFIEGPWQRLEDSGQVNLAAFYTLTYSLGFPLRVQQEDVLRFGGGGIVLGGSDNSGKLQLMSQSVFIQMISGQSFIVPLYPPTQLTFPADTYVNRAFLIATLPPIEISGEALGSGGWPTVQLFVNFTVFNTDSTHAHSYNYRYSLPYQVISRQRAV